MIRSFRSLREPGEAELEIKRSRFLGWAGAAHDEVAVQRVLSRIRAAHPDASHHAYAYRLGRDGDAGRFSDDGEPGGTAGRPIMEVLLREELVDALVVVTRYFGGTLLGSGGLTRAYGQTASSAVRAATPVSMQLHTELHVTVEYAQLGAVEQALLRAGLAITQSSYTDRVSLTVPVPAGEEPVLGMLVADVTAGTGTVVPGEAIFLPAS